MFRALFKKQLKEALAGFLINGKTKQRRSKLSIGLYVALSIFVFAVLALTAFGVGCALADHFVGKGDDWLYFAVMSLGALLLSTFGSVFSSYAQLYQAKDNEMLLSLPIPPMKILLSRMLGLYMVAFVFALLITLPMSAAYWLSVNAIGLKGLLPLLMTFVLSLLSVVLSCLLGWVVALIASKLKSKAVVKAAVGVLFLIAFYAFSNKLQSLAKEFLKNGLLLTSLFKSSLYPFYLSGRGCDGDIPALLLFTIICLALFALCMFILTKTFFGLTAKKATARKAVYREKTARARSPRGALLWREWKRFTSSSAYMLNASLGTVFMPAGAVALLFFTSKVRAVMAILPIPAGFVELACAAVMGVFCSFNNISVSSVSLEGKNIWISQTLPVPMREVLRAKLRLHMLLTFVPAIPLCAVLAVTLRVSVVNAVLLVLLTGANVFLIDAGGLWLNLRKPMLNWTNETVVIKQSLNVLIVILGALLVAALIAVIGCFAVGIMSPTLYLAAMTLVLAAAGLLLRRAIFTAGAEVYAWLN